MRVPVQYVPVIVNEYVLLVVAVVRGGGEKSSTGIVQARSLVWLVGWFVGLVE